MVVFGDLHEQFPGLVVEGTLGIMYLHPVQDFDPENPEYNEIFGIARREDGTTVAVRSPTTERRKNTCSTIAKSKSSAHSQIRKRPQTLSVFFLFCFPFGLKNFHAFRAIML